MQKIRIARLIKMKLFLPADEVLPYKRPENEFFSQWSYSLWKRNLKYPNICFNFYELKYFWAPFWKNCSTRPQNSGGLKGKIKRKHRYMWSFVYPINSSYKYVKKVKLNPNHNPNIFSEIIEFQENGGSGGIQAKIPNCTVYIGIAA